MQEYITGRVKLSDCGSNKAIKEIKDKNKDLGFILDEHQHIVVDEVPAVYGVRCGAVVAGFCRADSKTLRTIEWPSGNKKKKCTLADLIKKNNISRKEDTLGEIVVAVFLCICRFCLYSSPRSFALTSFSHFLPQYSRQIASTALTLPKWTLRIMGYLRLGSGKSLTMDGTDRYVFIRTNHRCSTSSEQTYRRLLSYSYVTTKKGVDLN